MGTSGAATTGTVLHWARAYDVLVGVLTLGRERRFRERLVGLARISPGESVLDVGCGTGSLAIAAKRRTGADGRVCGVDPSPEMVARSRRKATRAGVAVRFETAYVDELPFPDGSFDAVTSTLMLHHLTEQSREHGLAEIARVLRPGGRLLAVDLGGGAEGRHHGFLHRLPNHAHFDLDELPPVLEQAGLTIVERGGVHAPGVVGLADLRFVLAAAPQR